MSLLNLNYKKVMWFFSLIWFVALSIISIQVGFGFWWGLTIGLTAPFFAVFTFLALTVLEMIFIPFKPFIKWFLK